MLITKSVRYEPDELEELSETAQLLGDEEAPFLRRASVVGARLLRIEKAIGDFVRGCPAREAAITAQVPLGEFYVILGERDIQYIGGSAEQFDRDLEVAMEAVGGGVPA